MRLGGAGHRTRGVRTLGWGGEGSAFQSEGAECAKAACRRPWRPTERDSDGPRVGPGGAGTEGPSPHPSWPPRAEGWGGLRGARTGPEDTGVPTAGWHAREAEGQTGAVSEAKPVGAGGGRGQLGGRHTARRRLPGPGLPVTDPKLACGPPETGAGCWPRPPLLEPESSVPAGVPGAAVKPLCPADRRRPCSRAP